MILDYYKLREQPFGVTPDPRYLYFSSTHREALASALYAVSADRGFTALIAKPGMGKTTLLFDFLHKVRNHARTVFLFQTQSTPHDLMRSLLADLGIEDNNRDLGQMHRTLNNYLATDSNRVKRLIVVLDEAQNLDHTVLEMVRMLSNFETSREKLIHFVMAGQPQLAENLSSPHLIQLRQRISIIAHLKQFSAEETHLYIDHRLRVGGYDTSVPLFTRQAIASIAKNSEGIPRNINNLCFHAMSLGCVERRKTIDEDIVREVLDDLNLLPLFPEPTTNLDALETAPPKVRSLDSRESVRPNFGRSFLRVVGVLLVLAGVLWASFRGSVSFTGATASRPSPIRGALGRVSEDSVQPVTQTPQISEVNASHIATPEDVASSAPVQMPTLIPPEAPLKSVLVLPQDTLYSISRKHVGKYDERVLAKIKEQNPWLGNPDHIEVGQTIRVPLMDSTTESVLPAAEQPPAALAAEAEKP